MDGPTVLNFELHVPKRKREPRLVIFSKGLMKENVEKRTGKPFEQRVIDFKAELNNAFDAGGKDALVKKENCSKQEFLEDQVEA